MGVIAYVGIGSNVGNPALNVRRTLRALGDAGCVRQFSSLYRSRAWGRTAQPDFVNAAARIETLHSPRALLGALRALESRLGRRPSYRWGPRVIDLDVLAYGERRIDEPGLAVPHPYLERRSFVLTPLREVERGIPGASAFGPRSGLSLWRRNRKA